MNPQDWKWYGHAGHFICGHHCRFHLCTLVGNYLVSTVGELWFERGVREIHAEIHDRQWYEENVHLKGDYFDHAYMKRFGFEEVGYGRKYETMVFKTTGEICDKPDCNCGLPVIIPSELDMNGYNEAGEAVKGHYELCLKYSEGEHE